MGEKYLVLNGRKFISSRRASEISGYTLDYIGQLARANKLDSKMVGRVRFIDEYSLEQYIANPNGNPPLGDSADVLESSPQIKNPQEGLVVAKNQIKQISSIRDFDLASKNKGKKRHALLPVIEVLSLAGALLGLLVVLSTPIGQDGTQTFLASLNSLDNLALEMEGIDTLTQVDNPVVAVGRKADLYYLGFLHKVDIAILDFLERTRETILAWLEKGSIYLARIKGEPSRVVMETTRTPGGEISGNTFSEAEIQALVKEMVAKELAARDAAGTLGPRTGLFVVPSTGSKTYDQAIKEKVADAFSDEVVVSLDPDKSSGVVKPVFKSADGSDYLFVLVPVRGQEEGTTN